MEGRKRRRRRRRREEEHDDVSGKSSNEKKVAETRRTVEEKKEHTGSKTTVRLLELDEAAERAGGLAARVRFVVREQSPDGMLGICQGL